MVGTARQAGSDRVRRELAMLALLLLALACLALVTSPAHARRSGIAAEGCSGCHQGGQEASVRLLASPADPAPGQSITLSVEIDATNGPVAGFYLQSDGAGTLAALAGTRMLSAEQIVHSAPRRESGGVVRFDIGWTAPASPGGAIFRVWAVSANDNDGSGGDGAGKATLLLVYGCAGETFALDPDGDGFGAEEFGQKRDCSLPAGYARRAGDCAEYDVEIHPEAAERCNDGDDDCDGALDEGLPVGPQYTDADGDGHGAGVETIMDCSSPEGYAATRDDCDDASGAVHPGATEACNYIDDDCDGTSDEDARAACGVGWCRRLSESCSLDFCTPGEPRAELCNAFDDDCDDAIDEQVECARGELCVAGVCTPESAAGASGSGSAGRPPASTAGAGGAASAPRADAGSAAPSCKAGASSAGACAPPAASSAPAAGGCRAALAARPGADWVWLVLALALLIARRNRHRAAAKRRRDATRGQRRARYSLSSRRTPRRIRSASAALRSFS
jgi:hypothetical protein